MIKSFLKSVHPSYDEQKGEWEKNERRMLGGRAVLDELIPFDWEKDFESVNSHYNLRKENAVYLNFPDRFASLMVGHIMRRAPSPETTLNFGTLGEVRRRKDIDEPSPAELLYYNADGRGVDGSQWDLYWTEVVKAAVGTGIRWVLVEAPREAPGNRGLEIAGVRPILTDISPLQVKNWHFEGGRLVMAIIERFTRRLRVNAQGQLEGNSGEKRILLLTARGFDGFGPEYAEGGWFLFDEEHELVESGNYDATNGDIPMVAMYYEKLRPSVVTAAIARSGVTEMGNAAIAYMNLASAADFDAWDSATSAQALIGVDEDGFNLFVTKRNEGNRYAPLPAAQDDNARLPQIQDTSTGAVAAQVFETRLKAKRQEAVELMLNEIEAAPYASGESKEVSFKDAKAPRLAVLASNIESCQNGVIHFCELLWGRGRPVPTGSVEWPRDFDLGNAIRYAADFFNLEAVSQVRSPTAEERVMTAVIEELGIAGDSEVRQKIQNEYRESAERVKELPVQQNGQQGVLRNLESTA